MDAPRTYSEVRIQGRLGARVASQELPDGTTRISFTLIVDRPDAEKSATRVDTLACVTDSLAIRDQVEVMEPGTSVVASGSLRRRFWRSAPSAGSLASAMEVVVDTLNRESIDPL